MTFGPVGIRCPEHATATGGRPAPRRAARRVGASLSRRGPYITQALIGINVGVFLLQLLMGGQVNGTDNWIYEHGVLVSSAIDSSGQVVGVAEGEWWRLITAAFLHYGPLHLGMNMIVLWFIGPALEDYFGHGRYALLYLVSGLAGSAESTAESRAPSPSATGSGSTTSPARRTACRSLDSRRPRRRSRMRASRPSPSAARPALGRGRR